MKLNDLIIGYDEFKFWFSFRDEDDGVLLQLSRLMTGSKLKDFIEVFADFSVILVEFYGDYIRVVLDFSCLPVSDSVVFYDSILDFSNYEVIYDEKVFI